jgi:hypothetical protein
MSKTTPGPWTVAKYRTMNTGNYVVRSPEKGPDDEFPVVASVTNRPGAAANARLIAAAPAMKAVVERIAELTDGTFSEEDIKSNFAEIGTAARSVLADICNPTH